MKKGHLKQPHLIRQAHKEKIDQGIVSEETANLVWWLYNLAIENSWSNTTIGKKLGIDPSNISRLYDLSYNDGKISERWVNAITDLQRNIKLEEERSKYGDVGFIRTRMSDAISEMCDAARISQTMAMVWGETQTGKTAALKRYAQLNNHGMTRYLSVVEDMSNFGFLRALAEACGSNTSGNNWAVHKSLTDNLTPNMLLIVDEVHEPFSTGKVKTATRIIETLRGIHDSVGCGVVICGTNTLRDELSRGKLKDVLKQAYKRGIIKVQCPDILPLRDVWKFSTAYGLERPKPGTREHTLVKQVNESNGIGMLTKYLKAGAGLAANSNQAYSWKHFVDAHNLHQKYAHEGWWND